MNDDFLKELKTEYRKTNATWHLRSVGWEAVAEKIGAPEPLLRRILVSSYTRLGIAAFAILILFFGTYRIALAALPGDPLYPVKLLSEQITQGVTGSNQVVIDHRAEEIIGLSKKQEVNTETLRATVSEYATAVDETKKSIQLSGKPSIKFNQALDEQHAEFDKIEHNDPEIQNAIKDAEDASSHDHSEGRGED